MDEVYAATDAQIKNILGKLVKMYNNKHGEDMDPEVDKDLKRLLEIDITYPKNY
jgi:hypothetical protein